MATKLVSSDLNGTLVHQHTMSDMIRLYLGEESFRQADAVFKRQTSGQASMEEAFSTAGPLTKGLTLRQAIEYTRTEMKYLNGFHQFINVLAVKKIPFIINSTGYSVTIHAIRAQIGKEKIHGMIGNRLIFGENGDTQATLREEELERRIQDYFSNPDAVRDTSYDTLKAVGKVELGIIDEAAKAVLLFTYARAHFSGIRPSEMVHIGDTIGDRGGIDLVAWTGGKGIAFNYNAPLRDALEGEIIADPALNSQIYFVQAKGTPSDLQNVLPFVL